MKGLSVSVYTSDGDTTNGGLSAFFTRVFAFSKDLEGNYDVKDMRPIDPVFVIEPNRNGAQFGPVAYPVEDADGRVGPMFGGNFLWTSDSRFRRMFDGPIPIHDRFETVEEYKAMSD